MLSIYHLSTDISSDEWETKITNGIVEGQMGIQLIMIFFQKP